MQPLAAGGLHISFELQLLGTTCTVQLPTLRLGGANDGASAHASCSITPATRGAQGSKPRQFHASKPTRLCCAGSENGSASARRRRRRRSSFSSQTSDTSRAPSQALSLGTADEAVATLRQRLSEPATGAAIGSAAVSGAASGGRAAADGGAAPAAENMSVEAMLRASGEEMDDACLLRSVTCHLLLPFAWAKPCRRVQ